MTAPLTNLSLAGVAPRRHRARADRARAVGPLARGAARAASAALAALAALAASAAPATLAALAALAAAVSSGAAAATLEDVRERGSLRCGVNADLAGFASANSLGEFSGFDIDFCRAVAAAVLGDAEAFEPLPTTSLDRFDELGAGRFDVLSRNTTWTLDRDARYGEFAGTSFYDGQGFLVTRRSGVRSALELDARSVCVGRGTTTELNAADFFAVSELRYRPVYFDDESEAFAAYAAGDCDAFTSDRSALAAQRTTLEPPEAHALLPETISKRPLGPVVREGDGVWEDIVRWTLNCMINAEELGVTSDTAIADSGRATPAVRRLLGLEGEAGAALGLAPTWCADVVRLVGNYAEVYERNVGPDTPIGLTRGVNALWTDGGLLFAPPVR